MKLIANAVLALVLAACLQMQRTDAVDPYADCSKGLSCLTNWYQSGHLVIIPWVMVFVASPFAIVSLVFLVLGLLHVLDVLGPPACCKSYFYPHVVLLCLWPLFFGLALYLVVSGVMVMLVYVGWAGACILLHGLLLSVYWKKLSKSKTGMDHPLQQLLAAPHRSSQKERKGDEVEENASNPFTLVHGLIPGTSQYGYQIFIPTDPEVEYTGLPSKVSQNPPQMTPARR